MNPTISAVQKFTIDVLNTCPDDILTNVRSTFANYIYYIGENMETNVYTYSASGAQVKTDFVASWSTSIPYCPLDFEILRDFKGDGKYSALTAHETAVVTLIEPMVIKTPKTSTASTDTWEEQFPSATYPLRYKDPQITLKIYTGSILRTDTSYDGEVWLLAVNRVSKMSTKDNSAARVKFTLTLRDVCWDLPLTAAEPSIYAPTINT